VDDQGGCGAQELLHRGRRLILYLDLVARPRIVLCSSLYPLMTLRGAPATVSCCMRGPCSALVRQAVIDGPRAVGPTSPA
jgi:hypothetical protein